MRVLGISGSLSSQVSQQPAPAAAAELVPPPGELELFEGLKHVPPYDEDDDGYFAPQAARRLREAIASADALVIATPEYNSSIPGQLKNALDWASRPFPDNVLRNKPVAVIGASTSVFPRGLGAGGVRKVLGSIGRSVVGAELPVAGGDEAFGDNRLADEELQQRLARILAELSKPPVPLSESRLPAPPPADRSGHPGAPPAEPGSVFRFLLHALAPWARGRCRTRRCALTGRQTSNSS